jgi:hypothetical protein
LLATLDSAGGEPVLTWNFRPHYSSKKWMIRTYREEVFDLNAVKEYFLELQEYPTQASAPTSTAEYLPSSFKPNQSVNKTMEYPARSSDLGQFADYRKRLIFSNARKFKFSGVVTWEEADDLDLLLDHQRGVYPLIWDGRHYLCPDWTIAYLGNDVSEVSLDLFETFVP